MAYNFEVRMIKNWPQVFGRLTKFNFGFLSRGRFWTRATTLLAGCAPKGMSQLFRGPGRATVILYGTALVSSPGSSAKLPQPPDSSFPVEAYRSVIDSGIAAKAMWAHRCKVGVPGQEGFEILVLHGNSDEFFLNTYS
jgi:hypothetical protein